MTIQFTKYLLALPALLILTSLTSNISFAQEANLGDLVVRFCNDDSVAGGTSSLTLTAEGGEEEDICLFLSNGGPSPVTMKINFVDGTVTNDTEQKKACLPEGTKTRFGQFISVPKTEYRLDAGQSLEVHATAEFPTSYAGMSYGCITYQAISDNQDNSGMFNVLTRKANFIDILVEGEIVLGFSIVDQEDENNLGDSSKVIIYKDPIDSLYKGRLLVTNSGNVAQQVTVNGTVSSWFQSSSLTEQSKKILPGDSIDFIFPVDPYVPRYDGQIKTELQIVNEPVFEFQSDQITSEMRAPQTQTLRTNILIAPWKLLALIIALLLIIFALSRKRSRNQHVSRAPHTTASHTHSHKNTSPETDQEGS